MSNFHENPWNSFQFVACGHLEKGDILTVEFSVDLTVVVYGRERRPFLVCDQ
jgi:hypothetical protein